jgi:hypothetical protein
MGSAVSHFQITLFSLPVSQICALTVLLSTLMLRVANSTPIVDLDSRLNSFLVNRESTMVKLVYDEASRKAYDFCIQQQKDMVSQVIKG